tara:strand:+ start:4513 stop:6564 length:2052 start_codon:yes stop_codon:yes gene_type:complete
MEDFMNKKPMKASMKRLFTLACLYGSTYATAQLPTTYKVQFLNTENIKLMAAISGQALNNNGHVAGHAQPRDLFKPHELTNCEHPNIKKTNRCALESVDKPFVIEALPFLVTEDAINSQVAKLDLQEFKLDFLNLSWSSTYSSTEHASSSMYVYALSEDDFQVGALVPTQKEFEDRYYRDYELKGYVKHSDNTLILLEPQESSKTYKVATVGGLSEARAITDIDNTKYIVGMVSTSLTEASEKVVDSCISKHGAAPTAADPTAAAPTALDTCIQQYQLVPKNNIPSIQYHKRAAIWQYDESETTLQPTLLGFPKEENFDDQEFPSLTHATALDISTSGTAVGFSSLTGMDEVEVKILETDTELYNGQDQVEKPKENKKINTYQSFAVLWREAHQSQADTPAAVEAVYRSDEMKASQATAITQVDGNEFIVGDFTQKMERTYRHKAFYYQKPPNTDAPNTDAPNTDAPNTDAPNTEKKNFFHQLKGMSTTDNDRSTYAKDIRQINNQGANSHTFIIGDMETARVNRRVNKELRQIHGFIYDLGDDIADTADDTFKDLNSMLTCQAKGLSDTGETAGTLLEISNAIEINENGDILANALVYEDMKEADENGFLTGKIDSRTKEYVVRPVILSPDYSGTQPCAHNVVYNKHENASYKRQGAGMAHLLLCLLGFVGFRYYRKLKVAS